MIFGGGGGGGGGCEGCGFLWSYLEVFFFFFGKGVPSEETGKAVAKGLIKALRSGGCVDEYLQDQVE